MPTAFSLEVIRMTPPELGRCRDPQCRASIEWVLTVAHGRRMPVDAPLVVERTYTRQGDGQVVTVIDGAHSHFATCPAAPRFRHRR